MAQEEQAKVVRIHPEIPEKKRLIYAIQCGEHGPIKFGMTDNDPAVRLEYMQVSNHEKLRLIGHMTIPRNLGAKWLAQGKAGKVHLGVQYHSMVHPIEIERAIHALCAKSHIRGEWFRPSHLVLSVAELLDDEMGFQYLMAILVYRVSVETGPISYPEDWEEMKQWAYRNKP